MSATIASPTENSVMHQQTLYDKLWNQHVVHVEDDGTTVLYIDRQLLHEVTTPQAFEGLKLSGRKVWRLSANVATVDHSIPTTPPSEGIADPIARLQVETLRSGPIRLKIYGVEKTLVDCFRHRRRLGIEPVLEALL